MSTLEQVTGARTRTLLPPLMRDVVDAVLGGKAPAPEEARAWVECRGGALLALCEAASRLRDQGKGRTITFSPKVFLPLTRLCRDTCGYCTFKRASSHSEPPFMTLREVVGVARAGQKAGCSEALFTLGERPEQTYPQAKEWLRINGYRTTLEYLGDAAAAVIRETGLLPHLNPGNMGRRDFARLRPVSASMGLMLENISPRLAEPGGAHEKAPSKRPRARLKTLQLAGEEKVPFTSGLLVGIGESRDEIIESLLTLRELHERHGHIQEVIIQNFRAKPDTLMASHPDTRLEEMLWTVAVTRLILGPAANIQVPPNLNAEDYPVFLQAGINDWGGVSPVTVDHVNPEAPWPHLDDLRERTEELGFVLRARLPLYPEFLAEANAWVSPDIHDRILALADSEGYLRREKELHGKQSS